MLRFSPGLYGLISGAKGGWESENAFVIHREDIGSSRPLAERISATFEEDQVTLQIQEGPSGPVTLVGRLEE